MALTSEQRQKIVDAIAFYAEWNGAIHEYECPEDDTCDCKYKWVNDGVQAAYDLVRVHPVSSQGQEEVRRG